MENASKFSLGSKISNREASFRVAFPFESMDKENSQELNGCSDIADLDVIFLTPWA